jgi:hypothetical protein
MLNHIMKGITMGKGMTPKKGYNDKNYKKNYDDIDWSGVRKNSKGLMGSRTQVHKDKRQKEINKQHKNEMYNEE